LNAVTQTIFLLRQAEMRVKFNLKNKKFNIVDIILFALLSIECAFFAYRAVNFCFYPYPLENGEGICVHFTQLLQQGRLYKGIDNFPLIVANYPPVFMALNSIFGQMLNTYNPFLSGRIVSILSIIGSAVFIYKIVYGKYRSITGSIIAAVVFFVFPWANVEGIICRVDMLAGFFSLAGLYFILKDGSRNLLYSAIFFLVSLFTKHTLWAAPIAGFSYQIIRNKREGTKYAVLFLLCGMAGFFILNLLTEGEFYNHLIKFNIYKFDPDRLYSYLKLFFIKSVFLWVFVLCSLKRIKDIDAVFYIYIFLGILLIILTGREGSSSHYFFELTYGLSICCGLSASLFSGRVKLINGVFIFLIIAQMFLNREIFASLSIGQNRYLSDKISVDKIKNIKGPVLAEDTGILISAGKTVYVHTFAISKLIEQGSLNPEFYYDKIENRFFKMIVLESKLDNLKSATLQRFTKDSLILINRNYRFYEKIGSRYYYVPKSDY